MNWSYPFWKHYLSKKKYKSELCIQNQFYALFLFNNLLVLSEENTITSTNSAGLH